MGSDFGKLQSVCCKSEETKTNTNIDLDNIDNNEILKLKSSFIESKREKNQERTNQQQMEKHLKSGVKIFASINPEDNLKKNQENVEDFDSQFVSRAARKDLKTTALKDGKLQQLSSFAGIGLAPFKRSSTKNVRHKTINIDGIKEMYVEELSNEDALFLKEKLQASLKCLNVKVIKGIDFTEKIINKMIYHKMQAGKILYNQEEDGSYFYIIKSGKFGIYVENALKMVYAKGSFLGDFSLTNNNNKIITFSSNWYVKCIEDSELFIVSSSDVRAIQEKFIKNILDQYLEAVHQHPFLKYLPKIEQKLISEGIEKVYILKGKIIQEVGARIEGLYLISRGKVALINLFGEKSYNLVKGEVFNEEYCMMDRFSKFEFQAEEDSEFYYISKQLLISVLGEDFQREIIFQMFVFCSKENSTLSNIINENYNQQQSRVVASKTEPAKAYHSLSHNKKETINSFEKANDSITKRPSLNSIEEKCNTNTEASIKNFYSKQIQLSLNSLNQYKNLFNCFVFRHYEVGSVIQLNSAKKLLIILHGAIINSITKETVGSSLSVLGDYNSKAKLTS